MESLKDYQLVATTALVALVASSILPSNGEMSALVDYLGTALSLASAAAAAVRSSRILIKVVQPVLLYPWKISLPSELGPVVLPIGGVLAGVSVCAGVAYQGFGYNRNAYYYVLLSTAPAILGLIACSWLVVVAAVRFVPVVALFGIPATALGFVEVSRKSNATIERTKSSISTGRSPGPWRIAADRLENSQPAVMVVFAALTAMWAGRYILSGSPSDIQQPFYGDGSTGWAFSKEGDRTAVNEHTTVHPLDLSPSEVSAYYEESRDYLNRGKSAPNAWSPLVPLLLETIVLCGVSAVSAGVSIPEDAPSPDTNDERHSEDEVSPGRRNEAVTIATPAEGAGHGSLKSSIRRRYRSRGESVGAQVEALLDGDSESESRHDHSTGEGPDDGRSQPIQEELHRVDLSGADRRLNGLGYEIGTDGVLRFWRPGPTDGAVGVGSVRDSAAGVGVGLGGDAGHHLHVGRRQGRMLGKGQDWHAGRAPWDIGASPSIGRVTFVYPKEAKAVHSPPSPMVRPRKPALRDPSPAPKPVHHQTMLLHQHPKGDHQPDGQHKKRPATDCRPALPGSYWATQPSEHRAEVMATLRWYLRGRIEADFGLRMVPVVLDAPGSSTGSPERLASVFMPSKDVPSSSFGATVIVVPGSGDALAGELDPVALLTSGTASGSVIPLLQELQRVRVPSLDGRRKSESLTRVAVVLLNPNAEASAAGMAKEMASAEAAGVSVPAGAADVVKQCHQGDFGELGSEWARNGHVGAVYWDGVTSGAIVPSPEAGKRRRKTGDGDKAARTGEQGPPLDVGLASGEWGGDGGAPGGVNSDAAAKGAGEEVAKPEGGENWGRPTSNSSRGSSWSTSGRAIPAGLLHILDVPTEAVQVPAVERSADRPAAVPDTAASAVYPLDPLEGMEVLIGETGAVMQATPGGGSGEGPSAGKPAEAEAAAGKVVAQNLEGKLNEAAATGNERAAAAPAHEQTNDLPTDREEEPVAGGGQSTGFTVKLPSKDDADKSGTSAVETSGAAGDALALGLLGGMDLLEESGGRLNEAVADIGESAVSDGGGAAGGDGAAPEGGQWGGDIDWGEDGQADMDGEWLKSLGIVGGDEATQDWAADPTANPANHGIAALEFNFDNPAPGDTSKEGGADESAGDSKEKGSDDSKEEDAEGSKDDAPATEAKGGRYDAEGSKDDAPATEAKGGSPYQEGMQDDGGVIPNWSDLMADIEWPDAEGDKGTTGTGPKDEHPPEPAPKPKYPAMEASLPAADATAGSQSKTEATEKPPYPRATGDDAKSKAETKSPTVFKADVWRASPQKAVGKGGEAGGRTEEEAQSRRVDHLLAAWRTLERLRPELLHTPVVFVCQGDGALMLLDFFAELGGPPKCVSGALLASPPTSELLNASRDDPAQQEFWSRQAFVMERADAPPPKELLPVDSLPAAGMPASRRGFAYLRRMQEQVPEWDASAVAASFPGEAGKTGAATGRASAPSGLQVLPLLEGGRFLLHGDGWGARDGGEHDAALKLHAAAKAQLSRARDAVLLPSKRGELLQKVGAWPSVSGCDAKDSSAGSLRASLSRSQPHLAAGWGAEAVSRHIRMLILEGMVRGVGATAARRAYQVRDRRSRSRSRMSRSRSRAGVASAPRRKNWSRSASALPVERG